MIPYKINRAALSIAHNTNFQFLLKVDRSVRKYLKRMKYVYCEIGFGFNAEKYASFFIQVLNKTYIFFPIYLGVGKFFQHQEEE